MIPPITSVIKDHYNVYNVVNSPEEILADWAARVQHLAVSCEFCEHFSSSAVINL